MHLYFVPMFFVVLIPILVWVVPNVDNSNGDSNIYSSYLSSQSSATTGDTTVLAGSSGDVPLSESTPTTDPSVSTGTTKGFSMKVEY
jgi:hypothetical protein